MDILQVIKDEHRRIQASLDALTAESADAIAKAQSTAHLVKLSLALEINELYPELADSFAWFAEYRVAAEPRHTAIVGALKTLESQFSGDNLEALKSAVRSHFQHKESQLFPKIRQSVSTVTREDLGELFLELQQEAEFSSSKTTTLRRESAVV